MKVLPAACALEPDRVARFTREAQILASLNHPNIAAIYGLEDSGAIQALALELVEGSTLADRLSQGPMPLEEALKIARQIAEALEAAHEHGVVHRDLKPPTVSPAMATGAGVLIGTIAYMSPEQAKGKPSDKRGDIWAFGCVLYEMLTRVRAFRGEGAAETLVRGSDGRD